jgi:hypothetical protein
MLLAGCGSTARLVPEPRLTSLPGLQVGTMAERQLEADHPGMAPGRLTCPDLAWKVGAMVRCIQVVVLSGGRQLRIPGTVAVTTTTGGGRLHVHLADEVSDYGVTAEHLAADLRDQASKRLRAAVRKVTCPYLGGPIGTTVRCVLRVHGATRVVLARITDRDPAHNATAYEFVWQPVARTSPTPAGS